MDIRTLLEYIKNEVSKNNSESEYLWSILSALRGPDDMNCELKMLTTGRIRSIVFGNWPHHAYMCNHYTLDPDEREYRDKLLEECSLHFAAHYHSAVEAIRKVYKYDLLNEKKIG